MSAVPPLVLALVLCAAVLHATWNALLKSGLDRLWSITLMCAVAAMASGVAVFFLPAPDRASWACIVVSASLQIGYCLFLVRAYEAGELGQVYPIARGAAPMLVALGAAVFAGERLAAPALAGLALVTHVFRTGSGFGLYDGIAIGSAMASAYVIVTIRQLHAEGEHTSTIFGAQCAYGLLLCSGPALASWAPHSLLAWSLMLVGALCAGSGQIFMTQAFRDLPVGEGSLLQMLVPLGIAIGGAVFFREHFSANELMGAALILGGSALPAWRRT